MSTQNDDYKLPNVTQVNGVTDDSNRASLGNGKTVDNQVAQSQPSVKPQASSDASIIADDVDLIEKEWVDKAKAIVNNTVGDPHSQNEQITKMKVDYMKKRYGRDVKVGE